MFGMLAVLAELQRELILADTHDGLAPAPAAGLAAADPGRVRTRPSPPSGGAC
jgi:hypothetical protein